MLKADVGETNPSPILPYEKVKNFGQVSGNLIYFVGFQCITWNCIKYKKRYKNEMKMNLPIIPECEPMDPTAKPNMTRLCIITSDYLLKTQRSLGQGAFGAVYLVSVLFISGFFFEEASLY